MEKKDIIILILIIATLVTYRIIDYREGLKEGRIECLINNLQANK